MYMITGSIARTATRRYFIYSEADFEVFRPAGATRCTDVGEIWHGQGTEGPLHHAKFHPQSVQPQGVGPPKLKVLLGFDQNVEYKRPTGAYPLRDFHKICKVYTPFQDALSVKISLHLLKGLWSYGGFKLRVWLLSNIQRPLAAKLSFRPPKVLKVQEHARGPLSPCQVWWGSDFTRRRGSQKR